MADTMTLSLPVNVYEGQDFYVPSFRIMVNNRELPGGVVNDVMSLTYSDSLTTIDSFDMAINNWDPEGSLTGSKLKAGRFKYSDGNIFNPWKDVEVHMGYCRNGQYALRRMLTGQITTLAPNFPSSGGPTLTVRGLNVLHRFRTKQDTKVFFKKTDSEVAKIIVNDIKKVIEAKSPKLKLEIDEEDLNRNKKDEQPRQFLIMNNQFPIVFLMERARRLGYELSAEEIPAENIEGIRKVIFHFRSPGSITRPTYVLAWGLTLISFQPTLRTADQVSKVTVRGWNPKSKTPIEKTISREDLKKDKENVIDPGHLGVIEPPLAQEITVDRPVENEAEAKEFAKKILRQKASELVTAKGKTVGLPDLRAGVKVRIDNLGRFSGTYLVTETTHTIGDGGYTTDFTGRMEGGVEEQ